MKLFKKSVSILLSSMMLVGCTVTALTANASTGGQLCSKYATNALARSDNQICLLVSFAVSMPQTLTAR